MNTRLKTGICLLFVMLFVFSCATQKGEEEMTRKRTFATPEEAAREAQKNLLEILESTKDLNLGIDPGKLKNAKLADLIQYLILDFDKILSTESVESLSQIVASKKSFVAPFVLDNEVVGVAQVAQYADGWKVSELANSAIQSDLNESVAMQRSDGGVTLYEVPNLQLMIYGVRMRDKEMYLLDFEQGSIKKAVPVEAFYGPMRDKAIQFQKEYGELLKKEKLVD